MSKRGVIFKNWNFSKFIKESISSPEMTRGLQKIIDQEIKPVIARGNSPVKGMRKFPKYKDKDAYPADKKQSNKPNLYLSGEMLDAYKVKESRRNAFTIGIHKDESPDIRAKANANNFGTHNRKGEVAIAARPFIPQGNQRFIASVEVAIRDLFSKVLGVALKKRRGKQ